MAKWIENREAIGSIEVPQPTENNFIFEWRKGAKQSKLDVKFY